MSERFMQAAIEEARKGFEEGGLPIGAVLVIGGEIVGRGRNRRAQNDSAILHAELDCIENAGRLTPTDYQQATLYTTLSPCPMCSGAILLYKVPRVVIGENLSSRGPEEYLRSKGVELEILNDSQCIRLVRKFMATDSQLWHEVREWFTPPELTSEK